MAYGLSLSPTIDFMSHIKASLLLLRQYQRVPAQPMESAYFGQIFRQDGILSSWQEPQEYLHKRYQGRKTDIIFADRSLGIYSE